MRDLYASYGEWKYSPPTIRARVLEIVKGLAELKGIVEFDGVVVSGSSGVWLGGALQAHRSFPKGVGLVLVRKSGESSHGPLVEGVGRVSKVVFVDDFVSTGDTVRRVRTALGTDSVELVAVLEHCHIKGNRELSISKCLTKAADGTPVYSREVVR